MKNFFHISLLQASVLTCFILLSHVEEAFSFQRTTFVPVDNNSSLWIEGKSNVNEFECNAEDYTGQATVPDFNDSNSSLNFMNQTQKNLSISINIEVDSIECGKNKMNKDLQKALKADIFPEITFSYENAEIISEPNTQAHADAVKVEVQGYLTVAGNTRPISFITDTSYLENQQVRTTGHTTIRMTDFGVEPPTALMGLIRADDELTVYFDLVAIAKNY